MTEARAIPANKTTKTPPTLSKLNSLDELLESSFFKRVKPIKRVYDFIVFKLTRIGKSEQISISKHWKKTNKDFSLK